MAGTVSYTLERRHGSRRGGDHGKVEERGRSGWTSTGENRIRCDHIQLGDWVGSRRRGPHAHERTTNDEACESYQPWRGVRSFFACFLFCPPISARVEAGASVILPPSPGLFCTARVARVRGVGDLRLLSFSGRTSQ